MTLGAIVTSKHQHGLADGSSLPTIAHWLLAPQAGHRLGVDMGGP